MEIRKGDSCYYINHENGDISETTFIEDEKKITIDHVFVSEQFRGKGIAGKLIEEVIKYAKVNEKKIYPICSYAKQYLLQKEEYKDIVIDDGTPGVCKINKK